MMGRLGATGVVYPDRAGLGARPGLIWLDADFSVRAALDARGAQSVGPDAPIPHEIYPVSRSSGAILRHHPDVDVGLRIFVNRHILAPLLPVGSGTADQMIAFRIGAALVVSAFLAACASSSHRIAFAAPNAAEPAGASQVDMLVETTRSRSATPGVIFSGDRARERSRYHLVVSVPPDRNRKIGEVQWPLQSPPNPRTDFVTLKAEGMDEAELENWFSSVAGRKHKLFVFVHGFNSTFPEAAYRLAQIVHDSGMEAAPVLFT
jgi:hypothetical protein